jgi:arginyl-tRNA--protein-N-Asp/Glu arginylyltransferase
VNNSREPRLPDLPSVADTVAFYQSGALPCPYIAGQMERRLLVKLTPGLAAAGLFDDLTRSGFRRSHNYLYRPACDSCQACVPLRIPVNDFRPGRTMRRIIKANADLEARVLPPRATREQFTLFNAYQRARHRDGDMEAMDYRDYRALIENSPATTIVLELRKPDAGLVACCLIDLTDNGLSAVYSFFDTTEPARSLGTYLVLWLADEARLSGRDYLYLGYWIEDCRKMAYKVRFQPVERLGPNGWEKMVLRASPPIG